MIKVEFLPQFLLRKLNARRIDEMSGQMIGVLLSVGFVIVLGKSIDWMMRRILSPFS
jgi:hypothetical protein